MNMEANNWGVHRTPAHNPRDRMQQYTKKENDVYRIQVRTQMKGDGQFVHR